MQLGLILGSGTAAADIEAAKRAEAAGFSAVYVYDFFASNALIIIFRSWRQQHLRLLLRLLSTGVILGNDQSQSLLILLLLLGIGIGTGQGQQIVNFFRSISSRFHPI